MARLFDCGMKIFLALGILWLLISPARATVIPYQTLEQAIVQASAIVRGRILSKTYLWGPEQRHIYTDIQLQVLETFKGDTTPILVIRQLGGILGERVSVIPGSATYHVGEEVVLFLEPQRPGKYYFVMGLTAGKYQVSRQGTLALLHRNVHDISFHRPLGSSTKLPTIYHLNYSETPLSLAQLRVSVHQVQKTRSSSSSQHPTTGQERSNTTQSLPSLSASPTQQKRAQMLIFLQRWKSFPHKTKTLQRPKFPGVPIHRMFESTSPPVRTPGTLLTKPSRVPSQTKASQEGDKP